jgi:hypothetical protein
MAVAVCDVLSAGDIDRTCDGIPVKVVAITGHDSYQFCPFDVTSIAAVLIAPRERIVIAQSYSSVFGLR